MARRAVVALGAALAVAVPAGTTSSEAAVPRAYPFAPSDGLRGPRRSDALPRLWSDRAPCSVGCRSGAAPGWPVKPFHGEHYLLAGLNELRAANFHVGVDIPAPAGTPVYALQGGSAQVTLAGSDTRVRVGQFEYWHIHPTVAGGQPVQPYATVVGTVMASSGHVHLSEVVGGRFVNPLRPGGRILAPWRDRRRPVLGRPRIGRGGRVRIRGFDPQSFTERGRSTPVLALAGLAYRLFDRRGRRIGGLHWAIRGSQHLDASLRRRVYARGSHRALAQCAARVRTPCRPNWVYNLAGGLAPRLSIRRGRVYRLTAYAWDWAGNVTALDTRFVIVRGETFIAPR